MTPVRVAVIGAGMTGRAHIERRLRKADGHCAAAKSGNTLTVDSTLSASDPPLPEGSRP